MAKGTGGNEWRAHQTPSHKWALWLCVGQALLPVLSTRQAQAERSSARCRDALTYKPDMQECLSYQF
jgi:hypothetical protein